MRAVLAVCALALASCGLIIDGDSSELLSRVDAGPAPDTGGGLLDDAGLVRCESWPTDELPALDACERDNDCAIVVHARDRCGSFAALGVHRDAVETFDTLEALCREMYPPCRSGAGPLCVERDDACGAGTVGVACVEGRCESFLSP